MSQLTIPTYQKQITIIQVLICPYTVRPKSNPPRVYYSPLLAGRHDIFAVPDGLGQALDSSSDVGISSAEMSIPVVNTTKGIECVRVGNAIERGHSVRETFPDLVARCWVGSLAAEETGSNGLDTSVGAV